MGKSKIDYVVVGKCPKCGKMFVRPPEVDLVVCDCQSIVEVPLKPVLLLRPSRLLQKLERACPSHVSLEKFVNAVLDKALKLVDSGEISIEQLRG